MTRALAFACAAFLLAGGSAPASAADLGPEVDLAGLNEPGPQPTPLDDDLPLEEVA